MKKIIEKIVDTCGAPANFCFNYIDDTSMESDIRRMEEYVACVRKIKRKHNIEKILWLIVWIIPAIGISWFGGFMLSFDDAFMSFMTSFFLGALFVLYGLIGVEMYKEYWK